MNASPKSHFLDASVVHYEWNNAIAPRLTIDPGDTVVFETRDGMYPTAGSRAVCAISRCRSHRSRV